MKRVRSSRRGRGAILRSASALATGSLWLCTAYAAEWTPGPGAPVIEFSGYTWFVKNVEGARAGPGPNLFSAHNVRIAGDGLHLRVAEVGGQWHSAEIVSILSFGYGRYTFAIGSEVADLDPNLVLGLFTWSDDPSPDRSHREIDIEVSRWGDPQNRNAQCVVQPYDRPDAVIRFELPSGLRHLELSFAWTPDGITCDIAGESGTGREAAFRFTHRFTGTTLVPGGENARINLWQLGGQPPARNMPQEVVISSFRFTPLSRTSPGSNER
jgi:hypothetical protein